MNTQPLNSLSFQFSYNTFGTLKMARLVLKSFLKPYWFPERILFVSMYYES